MQKDNYTESLTDGLNDQGCCRYLVQRTAVAERMAAMVALNLRDDV